MNDPRIPPSAKPTSGIPHDDPRVTAYALGELEGDDVALIEQALDGDASLRGQVDAVRAAALSLREGFAFEPPAAMSDEQRRTVLRRSESGALREALRLASEPDAENDDDEVLNSPVIFLRRARWLSAGLVAAAAFALAVTAFIVFPRNPKEREFASSVDSKSESKDTADKQPLPSAAALAEPSAPRGGSRGEAVAPPGMAAPAMTPAQPSDPRDASSGSPEPKALAMEQPGGASTITGRPSNDPGFSDDGSPESGMRRSLAAGKERTQSPPAGEKPAGTAGTPSVSGAPPAAGGRPTSAATRVAPTGASAAGAEAPAPPAPNEAPGRAAGNTGDGAAKPADRSRDGEADKAQRMSGRATASAPRQPRGAVGDDATATAPTSDALDEAVKRFSPDEIKRIEDQDQLRALLSETDRQSEQTRDRRIAENLRKQSEQISDRLAELERLEAEEYARINDNPFVQPIGEQAKSTFAADVDTASYSNLRRFITAGQLPPPDAVRIEEMVNYFRYDYEPPTGDAPFSANIEVAPAPWNPEHRLARVGLRGKAARMDMRPATSLVFLIDVSGSMRDDNKLPLVKDSLKMLVRQLNGDDRLGIVTYAGNAGVALDSCYVNAANRERIESSIDGLAAGGSTNGAGGIVAAYDLAKQHFIKGGINRVILCTDGDFNVGVSSDDELVQLIEKQRESGVFLSVLGFGTGNLKDSKMEALANKGNGQFAYIDSINEAKKVLVADAGGTLITIAKDVKLQVQFNDQRVAAYRLIGYENRVLDNADFDDDRKDAGEIGSGHTMTALYEIIPLRAEAGMLAKAAPTAATTATQGAGATGGGAGGDGTGVSGAAAAEQSDLAPLPADQLLSVAIRYKAPEGDTSTLVTFPVKDEDKSLASASADFRFAAAVAEFGMLLRHSPHRGQASYANTLDLAEGALGDDRDGYRKQFMELVRAAQGLAAK